MFSIEEILKATGGRLLWGSRKRRIFGISIDSRTINRDELFIAIEGKRFDGHNFIHEAIKKGASGVVSAYGKGPIVRRVPIVEVKDTTTALGDIAAYHRRRFKIPIIGITGSNGKTTVKEIIGHILSKRFNLLKNRDTENNLIGVPLTLLGLKDDHSLAVLEMGANRPGEIARLAQILKPTIGLITNIGPSHLEFFKDKKGVLKAKSELIHRLKIRDLVFLNGDDIMLSRLSPRCKRLRFGLKRLNDFRATDIKSNRRISFILNNLYPFSINLLGLHNLYNALAAIAVSIHLGIDISLIREALLNFKLPHMRMEQKNLKGINFINDAYNSNPISLECAIRTFSSLKVKGKKIIVSGDMLELGRKGRFFHTLAGRLIAGSSIDALIGVGRLSRYTAIAANHAGMRRSCLWSCRDTKEATSILRRIVKVGDAVLVKGSRAMAMERIIEGL